MIPVFFAAILVIEIFALGNRGGGPLLSHLFLTGITFFLVCLAFFFRDRLRFRFGPTEAAYGAFFLFFCLSLLTSLTPSYGLSELLLFANTGILFLLFRGASFSEKSVRWFSLGLIALAVADTLIGFFIYTRTAFPRLVGTFVDLNTPYISTGNDFADFLILIVPLALWQAFQKHERRTTTLVLSFAAAILFSGLLLSFSRGAWMSVLTAGIFWLAWRFFTRKRAQPQISHKIFLVRAVSIILLTVIFVSAVQWKRSEQFETTSLVKKLLFQADEGTASASDRLDYWKGAVQLIKERPLFGSGVYSFRFLYPSHQPTFGSNADHPHNIFLKMAVENGLIATMFFTVFLIGCACMLLRYFWKNPRHFTFPLALGALAAFGHNLLDFNFVAANFLLFIIFIAVAVSCAKPAVHAPEAGLRFLALISFFLLLLGLHEGFGNVDFKRGRAALAAEDFGQAAHSLERARALFFQRDLARYLADAYKNQPEQQRKFLEKETAHTRDPELFMRYGEVLFAAHDNEGAEVMFERALYGDLQNKFRHYYNLLRLQKERYGEEDAVIKDRALELLKTYSGELAGNKYLTITGDNPLYATFLYEFFGMKKEADELGVAWLKEIVKFSEKYGRAR